MDPITKLKAEMEKKRKAAEPLHEAVATISDGSALPISDKPEKKRYLTNGQAKKLQTELTVRVGGLATVGESGGDERYEAGPLSPEQISAQKSSIEGKKTIPTAEVFKRLRLSSRSPRIWLAACFM